MDCLSEIKLSFASADRVPLDADMLGVIALVVMGVQHLALLPGSKNFLERAVLPSLMAGHGRMVGNLVAGASDDLLRADAIASAISLVGGNNPVSGIDQDKRVFLDIDQRLQIK